MATRDNLPKIIFDQNIDLRSSYAASMILSSHINHTDCARCTSHIIGLQVPVSRHSYCEFFKATTPSNTAAIIVAHNHPSSDVMHSPEDIQVTKTLKEAGKLLDIEVLDHIVIGDDGAWTSLKKLGHLWPNSLWRCYLTLSRVASPTDSLFCLFGASSI